MLSAKKRRFQILLVTGGDVSALLLSFLIAFWFRFSEQILPAHRGIPPLIEYLRALLVIIPVFLWVFRSYGLYRLERHIRRVEEIFTVLKGVSLGTLLLMALTFFYREFSYSRLFFVFLWFFACIAVSLFRYLLIQWMYLLKSRNKDIHRVLIVGSNRNARSLIEWAKDNPHFGHQVEGVLVEDKSMIGKHVAGAPVIGTLEECDRIVEKMQPDEVVVADPDLPKEKIAELLLKCEDGLVSFKVAADLYGIVTSNLDVEYIASVPLLGLRTLPLDDLWNRVVKRIFDLVVSTSLIMITFPVWLIAVIGIKITDGGSIFYRQERTGQDGRTFMLYKFRTMRPDAEAKTGPVWAKQGDDRCTPFGRFLRRFNIDELPQFWNVLKGDMSVVGPRPERPHFVDQFRSEIPRYMTRHKIKSGITGWAQVNGLRGNTSLQERIKYDLYYAENWSLLFDLEILFMTLFAFKNAY
ncbi:MAG: undecaprenyl-phosphate glucose phosphotransferase [Candidatus Omnitrophica bacterium]|nr:undecaprenyl-phosphate glucose phosphotransferase [Candidatus Omnitrophota bacterium]